MSKLDPEIAAYERRMKLEEEEDDIEIFLQAYPRATAELLELVEFSESPDAICRRPDGSIVGVEHTRIRRSPEDAFWQGIMDRQYEMDSADAAEEIWRLVEQKSKKLPKFKTEKTILLAAIYEADFELSSDFISYVPIEDFAKMGFEEIWLADFKDIREGAHREARLFGLFPKKYRRITGRSNFDQKPYG